MPDPDATGLGNVSAGQAFGWGSLLLGAGVAVRHFAGKMFDAVFSSWKSREDRLAKVEDDRFKLLMEEWKSDRQSSLEQNKAHGEILKENTATLKEVATGFRELTAQIKASTKP